MLADRLKGKLTGADASGRAPIGAGDAFGVLDIGSSKTVCLIVAPPNWRANGLWRRPGASVLGYGAKPSRGLKTGAVIDLDRAEQVLRAAVTQAEEAAGLTVDAVMVGVGGNRLKSLTFEAETRIADRIVASADSERLAAAGRNYAERGGRTLLHLERLAWHLDGAAGVANPRGMAGELLTADFHAVTVEELPLRNLLHVVERAHLSPAGVAPAAYASALAATTEAERQLGVTVVDMGAGSSTLAMLADGHLIAIDTIAVGGQHLTFDIARVLAAPFAEAERLKTLHGSVEEEAAEDGEMVTFALSGGPEPALAEAAKADINELVAGRITALLAQILERMERSGVADHAGHTVVLTGGGSQLRGLAGLAQDLLGRPVRIGRPEAAEGLPAVCCNPGLSTAVGLIPIALQPGVRLDDRRADAATQGAGYLRRVGQWLREGF
jgi:cell division protein FtsA